MNSLCHRGTALAYAEPHLQPEQELSLEEMSVRAAAQQRRPYDCDKESGHC